MISSSIAITKRRGRGAACYANQQYSSYMHQSVGWKRPHGQIAFSSLFQGTPSSPSPSHTQYSHEVLRRQGRQPSIGTHSLSSFTTTQHAEISRGPRTTHLPNYGPGKLIEKGRSFSQTPLNGNDSNPSFQRDASGNTQQPPFRGDRRTKAVDALSERLSVYLSDINLRHDKFIRSKLEQHENQYLPLDSINSIRAFTQHPSIVREAIDLISYVQSPIKLEVEEAADGEMFVKRTPPFNYAESIQNSHTKMMVVDGWPKGQKPSWAKSLVRSLLCNNEKGVCQSDGASQIPLAYYRFDNKKGALNIEFESTEGAMGAWANLERAMSQGDSFAGLTEREIDVQLLHSDQQNRSYQLQFGDFSLVARPFDMSIIGKETLQGNITRKPEKNPDIVHAASKDHPHPSPDNHTERDKKVQALVKRLSFFLSDIHLRHNEYVRNILEQSKDQHLPLNSIASFQRFIDDSSVVHNVVDAINTSTTPSEQSPIQLHAEEAENGEILVRRTPPFNYTESLRSSHKKMMVVDGWPKGPKPPWAKSLIQSLLCSDGVAGEISAAYWRFDNSKGVLKIEFESEEDAINAWNNLEQAMSQKNIAEGSSTHKVEVQLLHSDEQSRSYQVQIGDFSLVVRPIDTSTFEEEIPRGAVTLGSETTPKVTISDVEPVSRPSRTSADAKPPILEAMARAAVKLETDATPEVMNPDVKTAKIPPPVEQHSSLSQASVDTKPHTLASLRKRSYDSSKEKWRSKEMPSLKEFSQVMNNLYDEHLTLPSPSREWLHEYVRATKRQQRDAARDNELQQQVLAEHHQLSRNVADLVSCVKSSIGQGKIRGLGSKDGYSLSDSLGRAMMIYSETPFNRSIDKNKTDDDRSSQISPYEACLDVLEIVRSLNLDTHPSHFSYAIRAACHESRWEEAANLFLGQIDGDDAENPDTFATGGFVPIDPALGWNQPLEMGLYAVARNSWHKVRKNEEGAKTDAMSPSKQVFDTAMKMCMISPSGQDKYILAAGSALGRAGLWRECLDLAAAPDSISSYGPSIAAATMLACIECSRSSEAIYAYDLFMSGNQSAASEWQWAGGNITAVKPLCRDLALHAMGSIKRGGFSGDAMRMFEEIMDDDRLLSSNALLGLAQSLEHDGDWQSSIQLLKGYIDSVYRQKNPTWRVVSDALELNTSETLSQNEQYNLLTSILASVMRACNHEGQYGLSILLCSIVNDSYANEQSEEDHTWMDRDDNGAVKAILCQKIVAKNQRILEAYIHSLHGLGCRGVVNGILNTKYGENISVSMPRGRGKVSPHGESWIHAFVAMDRVLKAMNGIQSEDSNISPESRLLFERGLGRAMDHCVDSKQPAVALHLFGHASTIMNQKDVSLTDRVKSFFGMQNSADRKKISGTIFSSDDNVIDLKNENLRLSDPVLAPIIRAYTMMGQPEKARSSFYDGTLHVDDYALMAQSTNSTLKALLDIDIDECLSFLDAMDPKCVNPSTFLAIAKHYAQNQLYPEVGEVYNMARKAGCISEELGLITMQAVCAAELLDGKIVVLRNILEDISGLVGMKSDEWTKSKYWGIKRYVGFHYARLLMRWNDPATSQKEELLFAINEMRQCATEGIAAKNATLECIARIAQVYGTEGRVDSVLSDKQRRVAVNLILEACVEANRSGLMKKQSFTATVAQSLRALNANKECIQVVLSVISNSHKSRHRVAMEEGMYAALEDRDSESLKMITDIFENSGFDSKRLSI